MYSLITQFLVVVGLMIHGNAQVPLPSPPYLPPNSSSGAIPSTPKKPNAQWSTLLGNTLYFYDVQRSGKLPSTNRVPWRNDSTLSDGQDAGVDLSGGYFDAGGALFFVMHFLIFILQPQDYVKCTFPLVSPVPICAGLWWCSACLTFSPSPL